MLILYFSAKHHTQKAAHKIAKILNCATFELTANQPYSAEDLYYQNPNCRANREQRMPNARVAFQALPDVREVTTIFLGYPIWWDSAPKIIWNVVEQLDLTGKTLIPFCTSGGSSIDNSEYELAQRNTTANWLPGFRVDMNADERQIRTLVDNALKQI